MVTTIFICCIPNHLIAVTRVKVHIDIGHSDTTRIQESFKQQVVLDRVQVGNAQAIRNCTSSGRSTARTNTNRMVARVANHVPHNQEVRTEAHLFNSLQFEIESLEHCRWKFLTPSLLGSLKSEVVQIFAVGLETCRQLKVWEHRFSKFNLDVCPLRNPQRVAARFWYVSKQPLHLLSAL